MRVKVLLFARPREIVGAGRLEVEVAPGATVAEVFGALVQRAPAVGAMRDLLRCAVGDGYCDWESVLVDGDEVAFIPPTAGG